MGECAIFIKPKLMAAKVNMRAWSISQNARSLNYSTVYQDPSNLTKRKFESASKHKTTDKKINDSRPQNFLQYRRMKAYFIFKSIYKDFKVEYN